MTPRRKAMLKWRVIDFLLAVERLAKQAYRVLSGRRLHFDRKNANHWFFNNQGLTTPCILC